MSNGKPAPNDRFPITSDDMLSPPSVGPIGDCALVVHVFGFVPHADILVYSNEIEPISNPYHSFFGDADVPLLRRIHAGEKISATQTVFGHVSGQSLEPSVVASQPAHLGPPSVGPDLFACGRVVPTMELWPGAHVDVYEAPSAPPPTTSASRVGAVEAAQAAEPVVTSSLHAGWWVTATQRSCAGTSHEVASPPASPAVQVKPPPHPVPPPNVEPWIPGNDAVILNGLFVGALARVADAAGGPAIGEVLANAGRNRLPTSTRLAAGHQYRGGQMLCDDSGLGPPTPSTDHLPAPILRSPICAGDRFVTVGATTPNAVVVLRRNGSIVGAGGAMMGDLVLALGAKQLPFAAGDSVQAAEYMDTGSIIAFSNTVVVGDCANVLTQKNDMRRTGQYLRETQLTPATVSTPGRFGKLYERTVEGDICAQPLYMRNVRTPHGIKNLVFVATSTNQVYAIDADEPSTDSTAGIIWQRKLQNWRPLSNSNPEDICLETIGTVGITSTPVIDPHTFTMYVVARRSTKRGAADDGLNFLHALDVRTGNEPTFSPRQIEAVDPAHPNLHFDHSFQRNRPGLLLLNGIVYVAFGVFNCDHRPYHGWVMGYRTSDLQQVGVFCTSGEGQGAGIWQSGNGLVGDDDGSIYFETGNDFNDAQAKLGDSFVKLVQTAALPGLAFAGHFQPANGVILRDGDTDLGSGGPVLLPGERLVGGGKQGRLYVLDPATMKPTQDSAPDPKVGEGFQAFLNTYHPEYPIAKYATGEGWGPNIHGGPSYWRGTGWIYDMPEKDFMKAFSYHPETGHLDTTPVKLSTVRPPDGMPGGFTSISANGDRDGIVWTSFPQGNGQSNKVPGTLIAFDASTLKMLWQDYSPVAFAKFVPPTIAGGKVFRATFSSHVEFNPPVLAGKLVVYGLLSKGHKLSKSGAANASATPIEDVWRARSGASGPLGVPLGKEKPLDDTRKGRSREFRLTRRAPLGPSSMRSPEPDYGSTCHHPSAGVEVTVDSSIYWSETTGAHIVRGEIRERWLVLGGHGGVLGYPTHDETDTGDGLGRICRFERGYIVWHPDQSAREVVDASIVPPAGSRASS